MDWTDLQTTARDRGQLVFAMRQEQTPAMTQPGPWGTSTDGYCIGLAAAWISFCYAGKSFPVDAAKVCDNPPWQATQSQTLSDVSNAAKWADFWTAAIQPFQMILSDGLRARIESNPTADFLYAVVTQAYGCYGVTLNRDGGAHAVALRHGRDNRMHLFDANYGHFAVRDHTRLKAFLRWYLMKSGYGARYAKATAIIGIKPPM